MERLRTNPLAPASIAANLAFFSSWTLRAISFSCGKWLRIRRINPSPSPRGSERSTTARATVKSLSAHALRSLIIARKKLVGQRVTLENQIRGLAVVFGIRLPRALTAAFVDQALKASEGIAGLSAAMRGLIAARTAVMTAVAAIDADMRRMTRASAACRRLMTIPGVGQLTALAFVAAIDDPSRIRRSRDVGAYLGLVPRRYQSGEVDYVGSISKCGDRRCERSCTRPPTGIVTSTAFTGHYLLRSRSRIQQIQWVSGAAQRADRAFTR
jgi:transposase